MLTLKKDLSKVIKSKICCSQIEYDLLTQKLKKVSNINKNVSKKSTY